MSEDNTIENTISELKNILDKQSFIGKPIETEDKILIPITRMGFSFAAGSGYNKDSGKNGSGAVAAIEPTSMVVISKNAEGLDELRVLNISKGTEKNKSISDLGLIVADLIKEFTGLAQNRPINVDAQEAETYQETYQEPEYQETTEEETE